MTTRRRFLARLAAAGAAAPLALRSRAAAGATPPPETTTIRIVRIPGLCVAPQYVAEELLRAEGFEDVRYVPETDEIGTAKPVATGAADVSLGFAGPLIMRIDTGAPLRLLAGIHSGCFELFAHEPIRQVRELKGRTVAVSSVGSTQHVFLSAIAAYVGLDPRRDIRWAMHPVPEQARLFADRAFDAVLAFPPIPQQLRAQGVGRVVFNSTLDRPWSHYFCCMVAVHRDWVSRHPAATKRALRALLKAANVCALEPARVARSLADRGFAPSYELALQTLRDVPYDRWRQYAPEDTLRFYALRLREVGMVRATPQEIIARGADWRFLEELRRELKA
jgi:NitT/TauT family transport system substrate-binding protein